MKHMADNDPGEITRLLGEAAEGNNQAGNEVMQMLYGLLRERAARQLSKEHHAQAFSPTELVHETYLELFSRPGQGWNDRQHFFAYASRAMRSILIDQARRRLASKRGGDQQMVSEEQALLLASDDQAPALVALDRALTDIEKINPRAARVVELRFFAGLTGEEIAQVLDVSRATVQRDWAAAKAWLYRFMKENPLDDPT